MKQLIQTLLFFLMVSQFCFAQWYQQISGTTDDLTSVFFISSTTGWAVGNGGIILNTTDGGNNWNVQSTTIYELHSAYFISQATGWAVGWSGIIINTTDGGNSWTEQTSGTQNALFSVYFTSSMTGWVVGYVGIILHTTDGGNSWIEQTSGTWLDLTSVNFISSTTGWIVGGGLGSQVPILHTTDGGNNWVPQSTGTTSDLYSVYFTSLTTGWAVGDGGTIINTTDGGDNWNVQLSGTANHLTSVYFTSSTTGWAVGLGGIILNTIDGGNNWTEHTSGITNYLNSVYFTSLTTGWAVGDGGTIINTTNGGLPVELTSFKATSNGKEVILNWSTATELNNQLFEVQRSFERSEFATIGYVYGKGTTTERQDYSYSDEIFTNGKYSYRLKQIDYLGSYEYSDVVEIDFRTFNSYLLEQCYPNPFNPTTTIGFGIQNKSNVKITVLNSIGEEVAVVLNEEREPGFHLVEFNAMGLSSGVYFYQLKATPSGGQAGGYLDTKKMILLK